MNKQVLRLAIPNVLSNISVPLLSAVDTALVGHLEHAYYLGALAIGAMIFNFLYWAFGFLRMGTTGLTAQAFGREDGRDTTLIFWRATILGALTGGLMILLQWPIAEASFALVEASGEVEHFAREYFYIRIVAAPATLALYGFTGWFLGMQNARYPLYLAVFTNILNIGANLFFLQALDMKVDGVAWGTVVAQYAGVALAVGFYRKTYAKRAARIRFADVIDMASLKTFFNINRDLFIRTLCLIFAFSYFTAQSATYGDLVLAATAILMQFWSISTYAIDGLAFAAESLVGKYIGASDSDNLRRSIRVTMYWGLGLAVASSLVFLALGEHLFGLLTDKSDVIALAGAYIGWLIIAPLVNFACFIWDGIYIGATAGPPMRNSLIIATFVIFLPTYLLAEPALGVHALWLALTAFIVARSVMLMLYAPRYIYRATP